MTPSGIALGHEVTRDPHHHRREPAGIAAQVEDDAGGAAVLVDRFLERAVDGRHPDVEPDESCRPARRRLPRLVVHPHVHRRQVADGDRLAGLG